MRLKISHRTSYHFREAIPYALQQLRMIPKESAGQRIIGWQTGVEGGELQVSYFDQHHNHVELFAFPEEQHRIEIHCEGEVETADTAGTIGQHGGFAPLWYFRRDTALTRPGASIRKLARQLGETGESQGEIPLLHNLMNLIADQVEYRPGATDVATSAEEALSEGAGVCQDHAHLFIAIARQLGFPARYVSGYLMMDDREDQDAGHGWAEAHVPGLGWVGFDVSNRMSPDERYVRVATGLDYREAAPISGIALGEAEGEMEVAIHVSRVDGKPAQSQQQSSGGAGQTQQ
ncbi:MAG: transglutaminase family protein [Blastomonas sp.]